MTWPDRTRRARTIDGVEYAPGRKFKVVHEGGRLSGWKPSGPSSASGWRQDLHVGDVIECTGFGAGWGSDPGFGVEWTSEQAKAEGVYSVDFWPATGGAFNYRPPQGYLEPVEETEPTLNQLEEK